MTEIIKAFLTFLKIGFIGFGGGYGMLSIIFNESHNLAITIEQFAELTALDHIVPGPIAINSATYVGYIYSGFWGSLAATIGVCLPSFIIVFAVSYFIAKFKNSRLFNGFLTGVKPACIGLIFSTALIMSLGVLAVEGATWTQFFANPLAAVSPVSMIIFAAVAVASIAWDVNPILLTLAAAAAGALLF